jgi:hypothetical protein
MAFRREEWDERREEMAAERERERIPDLRRVAQAEVPIRFLTGSREWDFYLQVIQAMIVDAEERAGAAAAELEDPLVLDSTEMMKRKVGLIKIRQSIETMTELRDLPKVLVDGGRAAKKALKKYGVEY